MEISESSVNHFSSRKVIDFFEEMLINGERAAMIENREAKGIYIEKKQVIIESQFGSHSWH
jgi:hypothetical protein